ncbi:MAG: trehalase family glycosidase [Candidatus Wallacebacter cryptica]|jgi:putative isomerase|nr:trehalase / alfa-L-rhamnosidase / mannosyl oligosaccharide glucosidase [Bacillota bacterium]
MSSLADYQTKLREFFEANVDTVLKSPNSCLKHPFVDPGSVYDGNLWDWDSFWAVYALFGLVNHKGDPDLKERVLKHAKGNIHNFFDYQLEDGYIPMMIEESDLPEPYLIMKRKQGAVLNMMKPFLCHQIALISGFAGDFEWMRAYADNIERYFACYDKFYYHDNCGLYVWADDVMIGMDNDPATFGRPRFSTANMYLNSFMVSELCAAAQIMKELGYDERSQFYFDKAVQLIDHIQGECWDQRDRFFYSVDVDIKTRKYDWFHVGLGVFWKTLPIKVRTWTGFIPLWAGFATKEQAEQIVQHIRDGETFNSPYGIRTLAKDEKMYNLTPTINPSNWLGPIWIIVNYVVFRGLLNYGYTDDARKLYEKTALLLGRDLEERGTLHEYYIPETGEPVINSGFINWNMLVLNMEDELSGRKSMDDYIHVLLPY